MQLALSGDGQLLVVHAPLPYSRLYNTPGNANSGNIYTYKLVSPSSFEPLPPQSVCMMSFKNRHLVGRRTYFK